MAEFLRGSEINSALENIFRKAENDLILISPYIKLHEKLKDLLITHREHPKLLITIVFGKNKDRIEKSFGKNDFEFITQFPNVEILYHERLHAKFYQNDKQSLLTSMNLYDYSQNNNIEFGILAEQKIISDKLDKEASIYFGEVLKSCETLYNKVPKFNESFGGLKSTYTHSEVEVDKLTEIYSPMVQTFTPKFETKKIDSNVKYLSTTALSKTMGMHSKELLELLVKKDWIVRENESWKLTDQGVRIGGIIKNGKYCEYIAWREDTVDKLK